MLGQDIHEGLKMLENNIVMFPRQAFAQYDHGYQFHHRHMARRLICETVRGDKHRYDADSKRTSGSDTVPLRSLLKTVVYCLPEMNLKTIIIPSAAQYI